MPEILNRSPFHFTMLNVADSGNSTGNQFTENHDNSITLEPDITVLQSSRHYTNKKQMLTQMGTTKLTVLGLKIQCT